MADAKIIRPGAFRQPVQGFAVDGATLPPPVGQRCAVEVSRCVGLDEDGFAVVDAAAGVEVFFCRRHALAAEALVTFSGFRGHTIPQMLAMIDRGELDDVDPPRLLEPKPAPRKPRAWWKWRPRQ